MAKYSIFSRKTGSRKWERKSTLALPINAARSHWQSVLIAGSFNPDVDYSIRKVEDEQTR